MQIIDSIRPDYRSYLSKEEVAAIEHEASIMETREAAGIEALKVVQKHRGWISDDSLYAIAQLLDMPVAELEGVATFYNLIYRQKVGRYVIHICNSISCHLTGYQQVLQAIKDHLGIEYGQTTADGLFTLLSNACLGGCDKAPVMMIGELHYEHLTPAKAVQILKKLAAGASTDNYLPPISPEISPEITPKDKQGFRDELDDDDVAGEISEMELSDE
ncbi:NADH-quinone oxidoreductase subunit NuoE [Thalassomonas viridans]|uniref:NADH-quinone oxidoreductase subunit E n=1 Tax=Thalassomonas viridans TaxID=137584 RepID=A0AAE9YZ46_9GAMM|nr:NADH-quinone oxidoreductase subunit NuoE [Thalassomonas viridans]